MQLMSWTLARLGSRFTLFFEPGKRRVFHSALGRFLDQPLDLMVGLIEPDGTERVLPFTSRGNMFFNAEQFERLNSITFRGYSEKYRLRFEFNIHGVFYPQEEPLCTMPAFYMEMRVSPVPRVRWVEPAGPVPQQVKLFIRIARPDTLITAGAGLPGVGPDNGHLDLNYRVDLRPKLDRTAAGVSHKPLPDPQKTVAVVERIVSLNPGAKPDADGKGLTYDIPVTEAGSGIKWRLVWAAHCGEPVLYFADDPRAPMKGEGRFRYAAIWPDIDKTVAAAIANRDHWLSLSRRFEKIFDQAPLYSAQRHLIHQSFQGWVSNTWWCNVTPASAVPGAGEQTEHVGATPTVAPPQTATNAKTAEWFSIWEGNSLYHSTIDVEYNTALIYLAIWPRLLSLQLNQWAHFEKRHPISNGSILHHDVGKGAVICGQVYDHDMPIEENADYLLLLHAYSHWTADTSIARRHADLVERLARYLLWTDRDGSGFPSEGTANTIDDASPAIQQARKQTYLAVKRISALQAAADMLARAGRHDAARFCDSVVDGDVKKIERQAWLGDHYAVCVDKSSLGMVDTNTGKPVADDTLPGWDAYSIYTANGLVLPAMIGLTSPIDKDRLSEDLVNASREALGRYGCGHTSYEVDNIWVSQNIWRDLLARYLGMNPLPMAPLYWDMQVMSNTDTQSLGYIDTYIGNNLSFYPRGITSIGYLFSHPRLVIDRLAPGGQRISVDPDRYFPQRWPLLPLADWKAGKIPVCVVDGKGGCFIEGEVDPIIIRGGGAKGEVAETEMIG